MQRQRQQSEIEAYEQDNQYLANLLHFRTVTDILNLPDEKQKEVLNAWIQKEEKMESDIADWMAVAKETTADNGSVDIIGGESVQFPATPKGMVASGGKLHQTPSGYGSKLKALPVDAHGQVILPVFLGRSNIRVSILHLGKHVLVYGITS